jgi:hypothetical protein
MNMPLPDKIKNRPKLRPGLDLYWRAFWEMSSDREIGMGVGPIPWRTVNDWCLRNDIWGEDFERLLTILRGMDGEFMKRQGGKGKSGTPMGRGEFTAPDKKEDKAIGGSPR